MLDAMDSRELTEWQLLYQIEAEEREAEKRGGAPDPDLDEDDDEPDDGG